MLSATISLCLMACCAVGGYGFPVCESVTDAQSQRAYISFS